MRSCFDCKHSVQSVHHGDLWSCNHSKVKFGKRKRPCSQARHELVGQCKPEAIYFERKDDTTED